MTEFGHIGRCGAGASIDQWGAGPFEITVARKTYRFEDSDRFGPLILNRKDMPADQQPGERSPFWKAHFQWRKDGRRLDDDGMTCVWDEAKPTIVRRKRINGRDRWLIVEPGDLDYGSVIEVRD